MKSKEPRELRCLVADGGSVNLNAPWLVLGTCKTDLQEQISRVPWGSCWTLEYLWRAAFTSPVKWWVKKDRQTLVAEKAVCILNVSTTAKETAKAFPLSPGSVVFEFFLADAVLHGSVQWLQSLWLLSYVNKIKLAYFRPCSFHLCHKRPLGPLLSRKTLERKVWTFSSTMNLQRFGSGSGLKLLFFLLVDSHSWSPESTKTKQSIWLAHLHCALLAPIGFTAGAQGKFRPLDRE